MSKRYMRWAENWIEENIVPGSHTDVESDEARVKRLMEEMSAEAVKAGFSKSEIEQQRKYLPRRVLAAITANVEFDIDSYQLAWLLAMEHPDGD